MKLTMKSLVFLLVTLLWKSNSTYISIRGGVKPELLPMAYTKGWEVWTYENNMLTPVENDAEEGWVNPSSFTTLFLPSDLPKPLARPALGVAVNKGVPRYIMPSTVLSLETPARVWRNRGVCSLPRAKVWLDLFGPFTPPIDQLELSFYGRSVPDVRFLEDQDGTAAWQNLLNGISRGYMKDFGSGPGLSVAKVYDDFQAALKDNSKIFESLQDGYHFVDIPLPNEKIEVPDLRLAGILTDFDDSIRIVGLEDKESLMAEEAYGELEVEVKTVSAGRDSEYLPEAYLDLFEEGNIIYG